MEVFGQAEQFDAGASHRHKGEQINSDFVGSFAPDAQSKNMFFSIDVCVVNVCPCGLNQIIIFQDKQNTPCLVLRRTNRHNALSLV